MARPRVLVIGCGFGGIEAVRALSKAEVEITLVDRTNHHLFQPLLYQVATAGLSAPAVSAPIRHVLRPEMKRGNLTILKAEVQAIDVAAQHVTLDGGERMKVSRGATSLRALTPSDFCRNDRDDWPWMSTTTFWAKSSAPPWSKNSK